MTTDGEVIQMQVEPNRATPDVFLYRMLGGICTGASLILVAYSMSLAFQLIPAAKSMFLDFDVSLSQTTIFVFRVPWIPLAISIASSVLSLLTTVAIRRRLLVFCWLFALISLASIFYYRHALDSDWRDLLGSIGG